MIKNAWAFLVALFLLYAPNIFAQKNDDADIQLVLHNQEKAWNNGDLEAFMKGYWKSDSLMFVGKSGVTYGWQKTLDNYKKGYPDTAAMGKLLFDILEMKPVSEDTHFIIGKWQLIRSIGNIGGYFSLLFKKINGEWLIICDHTS
jgi:ketosteroid isomerase-like protein